MAPRTIVRIEISPSAKKGLDRVTERQGMTQVALISRVVEWFSEQPDPIKAAVLGQYVQAGGPNPVDLILKRMAASQAN